MTPTDPVIKNAWQEIAIRVLEGRVEALHEKIRMLNRHLHESSPMNNKTYIPKAEWLSCDGGFTFNYQKYTLEVREMTRINWWWRVCFNDGIIIDAYEDDKPARTKKEAMLLAEIYFIRHLVKP